MKRFPFIAAVLAAITLFQTPCFADRVVTTHNFQTMMSDGSIAYTSNNTIGTTDLVTYTCGGGAEFSANLTTTAGAIAVFMEKNNDVLSIAPAVEQLDSVWINYYPTTNREIKMDCSTDGVNWTALTVVDATVSLKKVYMPSTGNYYLRIRNAKTSNPFYIYQIKYFTTSCHCLRVVTE